jgi:glycine/D-amino acid oxidase-like deaminating enzyme
MQETARRVADVAIVGAGITGLSLAWHLAQRGRSVVVAEREGVGAGASGIQPGGVRQQWSTRVNCELARESARFYRDLSSTIAPRGNPKLEPCGYLFVAHSEMELARLESGVALQNECGVPSELVTPEGAAELVPGLRVEEVVGAAYCAEDGYFDKPQAVVEGFAAAVVGLGAQISRMDVVELRPAGGGWELLSSVGGESVSAACVVVAAGYDSPAVVSGLGIDLPVTREARYLFLSDPVKERLLEPLVVSTERSFAAKQLAGGRVLASDLGARGDPEAGRVHWRRRVEENVEMLVPILQFVSFPLLLEGFYDVTPDHQPIVGRVPEWDSLWIAAGFSGHGFMLAPAIARQLAEAICGDANALPDDFSYGRFDGARLVAETQVV